jgi:hypothetical protein
MTEPRNPFLPPEPGRPVGTTEEDRTLLINNDGTQDALGGTKEENLFDPVTGDRQYRRTKAAIATADGTPIIDPEQTPLKRCTTCGRLFATLELVQPCNGCCTSTCNACAKTMKDDNGTPLRLCGACHHALRWTRFWQAVRQIIRWLCTGNR